MINSRAILIVVFSESYQAIIFIDKEIEVVII
jgi:hypothetical protein